MYIFNKTIIDKINNIYNQFDYFVFKKTIQFFIPKNEKYKKLIIIRKKNI